MTSARVEAISEVLQQEPTVVAAWLFGSRASGRAGPESDTDIGVLCVEPLGWDDLLELAVRLEAAAGGRIDLVDVASADSILAFEAVSGRRLFVRDTGRTAAAVSLIAREYESAMEYIKRGLKYRRELRGASR